MLFKKEIILLLFLMILSGSLIFLNSKNYLKIPKSYFYYVAEPIQKAMMIPFGKAAGFFELLSSIKNLNQENINLKQENEFLKTENAKLREEVFESEILREQFEFKKKQNLKTTGAYIIGKSSKNSSEFLLIDKGISDGIQKNKAVVSSSGSLVGKISEVSAGSAKILIITDFSSVVSAVDQKTRADGIVKGEYGLGLVMDMISQYDEINIGDAIIASGFGGNFPKGILIGKIKEIKKSESQIFQKAIIEPAADLEKLEIVFVNIDK